MTNEMHPENDFIERVERLGSGELAQLRRGCGERDPVEGRCPWLVGLTYGVSSDAVAFLVAGLLAQYKTIDIRAGRHRSQGDFGLTWKRAVASGAASESLKRRFHILLDSEYDSYTGEGDFPYRLRQMVRFAAGKGIGVDWPLLLRHVKNWNSKEKWVQKKWAGSFFTAENDGETTKIQEEKD